MSPRWLLRGIMGRSKVLELRHAEGSAGCPCSEVGQIHTGSCSSLSRPFLGTVLVGIDGRALAGQGRALASAGSDAGQSTCNVGQTVPEGKSRRIPITSEGRAAASIAQSAAGVQITGVVVFVVASAGNGDAGIGHGLVLAVIRPCHVAGFAGAVVASEPRNNPFHAGHDHLGRVRERIASPRGGCVRASHRLEGALVAQPAMDLAGVAAAQSGMVGRVDRTVARGRRGGTTAGTSSTKPPFGLVRLLLFVGIIIFRHVPGLHAASDAARGPSVHCSSSPPTEVAPAAGFPMCLVVAATLRLCCPLVLVP